MEINIWKRKVYILKNKFKFFLILSLFEKFIIFITSFKWLLNILECILGDISSKVGGLVNSSYLMTYINYQLLINWNHIKTMVDYIIYDGLYAYILHIEDV